ncbi:MAG: hemolysin III family protein, partial [Spirochaetaceae bacterium]|nr:hemolysin III family protein [Spirochaetaceae bacterium]
MSEIQTIQPEEISPKKKLKIEAKQKIKEIKLQAKKDIADTKYQLFLELKKDNKKVIDKACRKIEKKRMKEIAKAEYESKPKRYSIGEEIFNSITHGIGVGLAIAGLVLLIVRAVRHAPTEFLGSYVTGVSLFGASMIILYLMSTLYHALTPYGAKKVFAIFDHCSIYILIAGTYTPFCIAFLRGALGWSIFGVIWGLAVLGIVFYSIFGSRMRVLSVITYILMGWMIIFAFKSVKQAISTISLAFLLSGG